jgi:hypothetical protein
MTTYRNLVGKSNMRALYTFVGFRTMNTGKKRMFCLKPNTEKALIA